MLLLRCIRYIRSHQAVPLLFADESDWIRVVADEPVWDRVRVGSIHDRSQEEAHACACLASFGGGTRGPLPGDDFEAIAVADCLSAGPGTDPVEPEAAPASQAAGTVVLLALDGRLSVCRPQRGSPATPVFHRVQMLHLQEKWRVRAAKEKLKGAHVESFN